MSNLIERIAGLSPEQRALLQKKRKLIDSKKPKQTIPNAGGEGPWPASMDQAAIWFHHKMDPDSPAYNIAPASRLKGPVHLAVMNLALEDLVKRHEVLRTTLAERDGTPFQVVHAEVPTDIESIDLRDLPEDAREEAARLEVARVAKLPFRLDTAPLFRVYMIHLANKDHVLVAVVQHVLIDHLSFQIMFGELFLLYNARLKGESAGLPPLPVQFKDYAVWRNKWMASDQFKKQFDYWRNKLEGAPRELDLPTDYPRPPVQSHVGSRAFFSFPKELLLQIQALNAKAGVNTLMVLLSGVYILLRRFSGQTDILIGTPSTNREWPEVERMMGCLINILCLRGQVDDNQNFLELLGQVKNTMLEAFENQDLPFQELVRRINPKRDLSRPVMYQVELVYAILEVDSAGYIAAPGKEPEPLPFEEIDFPVDRKITAVDMQLGFFDHSGEGLSLWWEYNVALFRHETIENMGSLYQSMLKALALNPELPIREIPWLPEEMRRTMLVDWNDTDLEIPCGKCIHELFEARVRQDPNRVALEFEGTAYSYAELNGMANRLAHLLRARGVGAEQAVCVAMPRCGEMAAAFLAVLKAGGLYVPLDPHLPAERLAYIRGNSGASPILVKGEVAWEDAGLLDCDQISEALADQPETNLEIPLDADQAAYAIYTSGSTGMPKGVVVTHAAVVNFLTTMADAPGIDPDDRLLAVTTISFDISGLELYLPLLNGATVVLASEAVTNDGHKLAAMLDDAQITVMQATPSTWRMLFDSGWPGAPGLRVLCGGEALPADLADSLHMAGCVVWNLYGPTETTIWSARAAYEPDEGVHIGGPIGNTSFYILNEYLQPQPHCVPGDCFIAGAGLARGYMNRPDLTAERFIPNPFSAKAGGRMYLTGDVACYSANGFIDFRGRSDHQVKLRGFRIELGEVEACLAAHPAVRRAVVVVREDVPADKRMVGYVTTEDDREVDQDTLRAFIGKRLPDYMIPAALVVLDAFPLTPNGKLDRKALPAPEWRDGGVPFVAPETPMEAKLAAIWCDVLGLERVGTRDNFFDLGGHSLLATRVLAQIRKNFGIELVLHDFFRTPDIKSVAHFLERDDRETGPQRPPLLVKDHAGNPPLSFSQEQLWLNEKIDPGNVSYNIPIVVRLKGTVDFELLERCLNEIVARHEVLRATFPTVDGEARQVIAAEMPVSLKVEPVEGDSAELRHKAAFAMCEAEGRTAFDLVKGPMMRVRLLQTEPHIHWLMLTLSHMVADAWSIDVLFRELEALYRSHRMNKPSPLKPLTAQFADFAHWQRTWLAGGVLDRLLAFWREHLKDAPEQITLPAARQRSADYATAGRIYEFTLTKKQANTLNGFCRYEGVTPFMALLAVFKLLTAHYAGQDDIVVGTPIANRNHPESEPLIGYFVNTLALRTRLHGNPSFRELLERVRDTALNAYAHQDLPFEKLAASQQKNRNPLFHPVFQVMFLLQNTSFRTPLFPGVRVEVEGVDTHATMFDIILKMMENESGFICDLQYNSGLFDEEMISLFADHFRLVLDDALAHPDKPAADLLAPVKVAGGAYTTEVVQASADEKRSALVERRAKLAARQSRISEDKRDKLAKRLKID